MMIRDSSSRWLLMPEPVAEHGSLERTLIVPRALLRVGTGKDRHMAGAVIIEILHPPLAATVPVLKNHDLGRCGVTSH
jgi:hypothetical protein